MLRRTFLLAFFAPTFAQAHSYRHGNIAIGHAWALPRQLADGQVFFPMAIKGNEGDELVAARSDVCTYIQLRENNRYDDPPLSSIKLEPGKPVPMRPTATHLRLVGMKQPLKAWRPLQDHSRFSQFRRIRNRSLRRGKARRLNFSLRQKLTYPVLETGQNFFFKPGISPEPDIVARTGMRKRDYIRPVFLPVLHGVRKAALLPLAQMPVMGILADGQRQARCGAKTPEAAGANARRIPGAAAGRRTWPFPDSRSPWE